MVNSVLYGLLGALFAAAANALIVFEPLGKGWFLFSWAVLTMLDGVITWHERKIARSRKPNPGDPV